MPVHTSFHLFI